MVRVAQKVPPPAAVVAAGMARIETAVVVLYKAHPPDAAIEYVTVYGPPTVDEDGRMAPVPELMLNAAGALKVPPVVPVKLTLCPLETEEQNAVPAYEMVADGAWFTTTLTFPVETLLQPATVALTE
jgi:hypothetical protein